MPNYVRAPFLADATSIGAALGTNTSVSTHTNAFASQGILAVGSASATSVAQSPSGSPIPQVSADALAFASGGNLNIGLSGTVSGYTGKMAFQHSDAYASSTSIFSGPASYSIAGHAPQPVSAPSAKTPAATPSWSEGNSASIDLAAAAMGANTHTFGSASVMAIEDQFSAVNATVTAGVA